MIFKNGTVEQLILQAKKGMIVFGSSNIAITFLKESSKKIGELPVLFFVDNDSNTWGKYLEFNEKKYPVKNPESVREIEDEDIVIVIASTYVFDIAYQLEQFENLKNNKCYAYTVMKWQENRDLTDYISKTLLLRKKYENQARQFEKIKNSHVGERCFVIGNGPSLTPQDLDLLKGEYCFAANQIFFIFDKTEWRPNVYLTANTDTVAGYFQEIQNIDAEYKFIDSKALDYGIEISDALYLKHGCFSAEEERFSSDIAKYYYNGGTITYTAMQVAVYMGFSEIYLLGVDNNYSNEKKRDGKEIHNKVQDHFYEQKNESAEKLNLYATVDIDHLTEYFELAKKYADLHGVKIWNATRGGKLEIYPRIELEEVILQRSVGK